MGSIFALRYVVRPMRLSRQLTHSVFLSLYVCTKYNPLHSIDIRVEYDDVLNHLIVW